MRDRVPGYQPEDILMEGGLKDEDLALLLYSA